MRRKVGQSAGTPLLLRYKYGRGHGGEDGEILFGLKDNEKRHEKDEISQVRSFSFGGETTNSPIEHNVGHC